MKSSLNYLKLITECQNMTSIYVWGVETKPMRMELVESSREKPPNTEIE